MQFLSFILLSCLTCGAQVVITKDGIFNTGGNGSVSNFIISGDNVHGGNIDMASLVANNADKQVGMVMLIDADGHKALGYYSSTNLALAHRETAGSTTILATDHFVTFTNSATVTGTLSSASAMAGRLFAVSAAGSSRVVVQATNSDFIFTSMATNSVTLNVGDSMDFFSYGTGWKAR